MNTISHTLYIKSCFILQHFHRMLCGMANSADPNLWRSSLIITQGLFFHKLSGRIFRKIIVLFFCIVFWQTNNAPYQKKTYYMLVFCNTLTYSFPMQGFEICYLRYVIWQHIYIRSTKNWPSVSSILTNFIQGYVYSETHMSNIHVCIERKPLHLST